jgi:hypothetical protein
MIRVAFVIGGYPPEEHKRRADPHGRSACQSRTQAKPDALAKVEE